MTIKYMYHMELLLISFVSNLSLMVKTNHMYEKLYNNRCIYTVKATNN